MSITRWLPTALALVVAAPVVAEEPPRPHYVQSNEQAIPMLDRSFDRAYIIQVHVNESEFDGRVSTTRVLSRPQFQTPDGVPAQVAVGEKLPLPAPPGAEPETVLDARTIRVHPRSVDDPTRVHLDVTIEQPRYFHRADGRADLRTEVFRTVGTFPLGEIIEIDLGDQRDGSRLRADVQVLEVSPDGANTSAATPLAPADDAEGVVVVTHTMVKQPPLLRKIPYFGRLFKDSGAIAVKRIPPGSDFDLAAHLGMPPGSSLPFNQSADEPRDAHTPSAVAKLSGSRLFQRVGDDVEYLPVDPNVNLRDEILRLERARQPLGVVFDFAGDALSAEQPPASPDHAIAELNRRWERIHDRIGVDFDFDVADTLEGANPASPAAGTRASCGDQQHCAVGPPRTQTGKATISDIECWLFVEPPPVARHSFRVAGCAACSSCGVKPQLEQFPHGVAVRAALAGRRQVAVPDDAPFTPEEGVRVGMELLSDIEAELWRRAALGDEAALDRIGTDFDFQVDEQQHDPAGEPLVTMTYPVGDLPCWNREGKKAVFAPGFWIAMFKHQFGANWESGASIDFDAKTASLVIRHTPEMHGRIAEGLAEVRASIQAETPQDAEPAKP